MEVESWSFGCDSEMNYEWYVTAYCDREMIVAISVTPCLPKPMDTWHSFLPHELGKRSDMIVSEARRCMWDQNRVLDVISTSRIIDIV